MTLRDRLRLLRCRLTGGHEMGVWRPGAYVASAWQTDTSYTHVWCRRCGWCASVRSFDEEDEARAMDAARATLSTAIPCQYQGCPNTRIGEGHLYCRGHEHLEKHQFEVP